MFQGYLFLLITIFFSCLFVCFFPSTYSNEMASLLIVSLWTWQRNWWAVTSRSICILPLWVAVILQTIANHLKSLLLAQSPRQFLCNAITEVLVQIQTLFWGTYSRTFMSSHSLLSVLSKLCLTSANQKCAPNVKTFPTVFPSQCMSPRAEFSLWLLPRRFLGLHPALHSASVILAPLFSCLYLVGQERTGLCKDGGVKDQHAAVIKFLFRTKKMQKK